MLDRQLLALPLDRGQKLRIVERRGDLARQQDGELEVLIFIAVRFRGPEVQRADDLLVEVDRHDDGRDIVLARRANPRRAAEGVDASRLTRADRLASEPTIDRERALFPHEAAHGGVVQRVQVIMRAVVGDEHDAGAPEFQHPLNLQDRGPEDLVQVERRIDQRGQLAHHLEARRPDIP